jgi:hypothetical protein
MTAESKAMLIDPWYDSYKLPPLNTVFKLALDRHAREQLRKVIALLDPPAAKREYMRENVHLALADLQLKKVERLNKQVKLALARYITALREVRASYTALNPSMHRFFALEPSAIHHDLVEADAMLKYGPKPARKRPPNKRARLAVAWARFLLEAGGYELTTKRGGQWHKLSQILADTRSDLRHHLSALAEKL